MAYLTYEDVKRTQPEDATHFHPETDDYFACWYKKDGESWLGLLAMMMMMIGVRFGLRKRKVKLSHLLIYNIIKSPFRGFSFISLTSQHKPLLTSLPCDYPH